MFRLVFVLLFALLMMTPIKAQETTPDPNGWPIMQRCVGELPYPTIPQNKWTFDGVIFSENQDGVRATRTDFDTSYFVALEGSGSFASVGAFSPDGRWFAYPVGVTDFEANNMGAEAFYVSGIKVVSTNPRQITHLVSWDISRSYSGMGFSPRQALRSIQWLDNEHFILFEGTYSTWGVVNAFTGDTSVWNNDTSLHNLYLFSSDFTRAFYVDYFDERILKLYDVENDKFIKSFEAESASTTAWLPDSSAFVLGSFYDPRIGGLVPNNLTLFDRNGEPLEVIATVGDTTNKSWNSAVFSQNGEKLAFTLSNQLFMADIEERSVTNFCLEIKSYSWKPGLAWSPDGMLLVFTYDGYPILLNTETLEMQILDYPTGEIVGWYPLDK